MRRRRLVMVVGGLALATEGTVAVMVRPTLACLAALAVLPAGLAAGPPKAAAALSDADRLKLLKPVMSEEELKRVCHGKPFGQACGGIVDKAGRDWNYFRNIYYLDLPGSPKPQTMSFGYIGDGPARSYRLHEVAGPGFKYVPRDGKFVAVEGPPNP